MENNSYKIYASQDWVQEQLGNAGSVSDWNQNDETAPDYVKNRPFYVISDAPESIAWNCDDTNGRESVDYYGFGAQTHYKVSNIIPNIENIVGSTFTLLLDGFGEDLDGLFTEYITSSDIRHEQGFYEIKGGSIIVVTEAPAGQFQSTGIYFRNDKVMVILEIGNVPDSATIDITLDFAWVVKKIDKKFIPDSALIGKIGEGKYAETFNSPSNSATGECSHAEGGFTTASGMRSHAEGYKTTASGDESHAEGMFTIASGHRAHAEGQVTIASGQRAHAEGQVTVADGYSSHAEGEGTIANGHYQHTQGKYNIADETNSTVHAHIVGNGTDDNSRSNAHTLDWEGNAWFAGDVYVGSTSGKNKDDGSKKLATIDDIAQSDWN